MFSLAPQRVADYDRLNRRIEDLQDSLKGVRTSLVLTVRGVRITGYGEETQEFLSLIHI